MSITYQCLLHKWLLLPEQTQPRSGACLVRMAAFVALLVLAELERGGRSRTGAFIHLFLCSRSCCSPSVSSLYPLCTPLTQGGVCQLSMEVRGLRIPLKVDWGVEAWLALEESLSPQCYPASFVVSVKTLTSWSCLPCSQRYQRTTQTESSRLLTILACSTTCLRLLAQSLP